MLSLFRKKTVLHTPLHRLSLPESNQSRLNFCDGTRLPAVKSWLQELPATKLDICGLNLYRALPELAQVDLAPRTRLEMLESMRKLAMSSSSALAKTLTKHSLTLNDLELKSVVVSQGVLKSLAQGYLKSARDLINEKNTSPQILALAMHRALDALNVLLLRTYLLYVPVPSHIWESIYAIYLTAVQIRVENHKVVDTLTQYSSDSVKQIMARTLSLACSAPSKLSTADICSLYTKLKLFENFIDIDPWNATTEHIFAIDTHCDDAPDFISNFSEEHLVNNGFTLGFHRLIPRVDELSVKPIKPHNLLSLPNPAMSSELKNHLKEYWQGLLIRKHNRKEVDKEFEIVADLESLLPLSSPNINPLTKGTSSLPSSNVKTTARSDTHHINDATSDTSPTNVSSLLKPFAPNKQPIIKLNCWNESTNGYCLRWKRSPNQEIRHKQLMGLKKSPAHPWQVVSVCWIRKFKQDLLIGVQAMSSFTEATTLRINPKQSTATLPSTAPEEVSALLLYSHKDEQPHSMLIPRKWIIDHKLNQTPSELMMSVPDTQRSSTKGLSSEVGIQLSQIIFQNDHYLQFYFSQSSRNLKKAGA